MGLVRIALVAAAAVTAPQSVPAPPERPAADYFERASALIEQHHFNRARVDWPQALARAKLLLSGAREPADAYPAIRALLETLGERHSFLVPPTQPSGTQGTGAASARTPQPDSLPNWKARGNIGSLRLPMLNTLSPNGESAGAAYTAEARAGLVEMDGIPQLCGWIIDLRGNTGGNMWPMLKALDPLLGAAPFGAFVQTDGSTQAWQRLGGNVFPSAERVPPSRSAFPLKHASAPLAVLIDQQTASSGEMVAIALIGRQGVRAFGTPSAGFTTGNNVYPLSDGAMLVLTEVTTRDRTGKAYAGPIVPDEQVPSPAAERAASQWLARQCAG